MLHVYLYDDRWLEHHSRTIVGGNGGLTSAIMSESHGSRADRSTLIKAQFLGPRGTSAERGTSDETEDTHQRVHDQRIGLEASDCEGTSTSMATLVERSPIRVRSRCEVGIIVDPLKMVRFSRFLLRISDYIKRRGVFFSHAACIYGCGDYHQLQVIRRGLSAFQHKNLAGTPD